MTVDVPRAWEISRSVPPVQHPHPRCSFRQMDGAFLCDCEVLNQHPEELDLTTFYGAGGVPITAVRGRATDGTEATTGDEKP